jgi:hypothetical protein
MFNFNLVAIIMLLLVLAPFLPLAWEVWKTLFSTEVTSE